MMTPEARRLGVLGWASGVGFGVGWFGGSVLCGGVLGWVVGWLVAEMMIPSAPFCLPSVSLFEEGLQTGMYPPRVPSEGSDKKSDKTLSERDKRIKN